MFARAGECRHRPSELGRRAAGCQVVWVYTGSFRGVCDQPVTESRRLDFRGCASYSARIRRVFGASCARSVNIRAAPPRRGAAPATCPAPRGVAALAGGGRDARGPSIARRRRAARRTRRSPRRDRPRRGRRCDRARSRRWRPRRRVGVDLVGTLVTRAAQARAGAAHRVRPRRAHGRVAPLVLAGLAHHGSGMWACVDAERRGPPDESREQGRALGEPVAELLCPGNASSVRTRGRNGMGQAPGGKHAVKHQARLMEH